MAREMVDVHLEEHTFTIGQMDPFVSFRLFTRLTKMAAPVAGRLTGSGGNPTDAATDSSWFVGALTELADRLDEDQLVKTLSELLACVLIDGRKINPVIDFSGRVPLMLKVAAEVVRVEYGGFLQFVPSRPSGEVSAPSILPSPTT